MHYLSVENLSKSFGVKPLFQNISFNVNEGDKIAIIARNGSGKSTLLKVLAGLDQADSGKLWIHKDVNVALFEQDPHFEDEKSILDNIFHVNHPVVDAIKCYEIAIEKNDDALIGEALIKMDDMSAWDFDSKVKQILGKLNIHNLEQQVGTLSGGQKKRVALARILIDLGFEHRHTLLIMDEPTNHLDVEMVEWLEYYLNQEKVTLLLVTHDRYFLDAVVNCIWEIDGSEMHVYRGDYDVYMEQKAARIESEQATIDKAKNLYRKELEWMRKQPKARTTKSKSRQDNFHDVEAKAKKRIEDNQVQLEMKMNRLGGKIAEMKKVYHAFGEKKILKGFDYTFNKGERLGIIGKNGAGKSTFLQILQQIIQPDSGKINIGDTIVFGNFSQQGLQYKEDKRVIEFVKDIAENFPLAKGGSISAAQFLELFLFTPEQQYTYLSKLSGGERKRLQLLCVLFKNPNFLILDEPTNDLDLPTLGVLEHFLSDFQGCLIIVSHDRYFMDRLVDHLFVFEGDGVITDFPGSYSDYRVIQKIKERESNEVKSKNTVVNEPVIVAETVAKKKRSFKEQKELELIEKSIPELESEKERIALKMSEGLDFKELSALSARSTEINNLIEQYELRWLELNE
jgi:ATP-binding cassette subfamily F protein uup